MLFLRRKLKTPSLEMQREHKLWFLSSIVARNPIRAGASYVCFIGFAVICASDGFARLLQLSGWLRQASEPTASPQGAAPFSAPEAKCQRPQRLLRSALRKGKHVHSASGCNPKRCFCRACYRASYVYASIQGRGRTSPPCYQLKPPILMRTHTSNFGWTGIEERGAPMQYYIGDDRSTQGRSSGCLCCGSWSHQKADCPVVDRKCLTCGRAGHLKAVCRYGSGPRPKAQDEKSAGCASADSAG